MVKFGIITESLIFRKWEVECIKKALNINNVTLEMFILPSRNHKLYNKSNFLFKIFTAKRFSTLFFNIYKKLFINPDCFSRIDLSDDFGNIEKVYFYNYEKKISANNFLKKDLEKIKNKNLDFIISFIKIESIDSEFQMVTKHGIWTYHHDDEEKYRGNLHCFWEIYHGDEINGAVLKKLTQYRNKFIILREGYFKTINYSFKRNIKNVYSQSIEWLKQLCIDILNNNLFYINNYRESKAKYFYEPTNMQFIKFYFILLKNRFVSILRKFFFFEQWNIGYINKPIDQFLENDDELEVNWIFSLDKSRSYADPFPIKWRNKIYIFFENYVIKNNKGEIGAISLEKSQILAQNIEPVISKPFHLSYPFVFNYRNEIYLLPESIKTKEITLYKAVKFPFIWEKTATILRNFACSDPTIFFYNDSWWLACSGANGEKNNKLYIFYSKDLYGPWISHKNNPVKVDVRSSRPAGRIFEYKGRLIRPSQDCSKTYGRRIIINEILKLTPFEFKERIIKIINPDYNSCFDKGIHTFNPIGDIIIVDGKKDLFLFNKFLIKRKAKYIQQYT
ncbi:MAG: glucosamine inositolphosphorylceramide transferase family protein [Promethearchaeota archaeon]